MRKPDGTCVWYTRRHLGYGEELRKPTKEEIDGRPDRTVDEGDKDASDREDLESDVKKLAKMRLRRTKY